MQFDHLGVPTTKKHAGEIWIEASRVWVTDAHRHPFNVEWLRYEPDTSVSGPLHDQPHLGFRVERKEQVQELSKGMKVLIAPFDTGFCLAGFYETDDGALIELIWYYGEMTAWAERIRPEPK
jgi:hypothetical protein